MKNLLVVYRETRGGEFIATQNLTSNLKKINPKKIYVQKIKDLEINWHPKVRLQLVFNFFKSSLRFCQVIWNYRQKNISTYYSTSLLFLSLGHLINSILNRQAVCFYHFHGRDHDTLAKELNKEQNFLRKIFYIFPFYSFLFWLEKNALNNVRTIFLPSPSALRELEELFDQKLRKKTIIIPNGVNHRIFYPPTSLASNHKAKFKILYVGRVDFSKHIDLLFETYSILKNKINCQLDLVIPKIIDDNINQWFFQLRQKTKVKVLIDLEPPKIADCYRQADLTLLLSAKDNFPLAYLESLSCGTPMLISNINDLLPCQKKISRQLIIDTLNRNSLVKRVLQYYFLPKKEKNRIKKSCLKVAKNFNWEKSAKMLYQKINE